VVVVQIVEAVVLQQDQEGQEEQETEEHLQVDKLMDHLELQTLVAVEAVEDTGVQAVVSEMAARAVQA